MLCKPTTYMNRSGIAAVDICDLYRVEPDEIIIILDDFNLEFGLLRLRKGGSAGGHNGLDSVINMLHTDMIPRMRIGIGSPNTDDAADYVLSPFDDSEHVENLIEKGCESVEYLFGNNIENAMSRINQRRVDE